MNMFYLSESAQDCAVWAVDSHCVKMILEASQLLSTAHRLLDGVPYTDKTKTGRNVQRWRLPDDRETILYSATHVNHPCAIWCRETRENYFWLHEYLVEHCDEYTYRYGKVHKVESSGLLSELAKHPNNLTNPAWSEPPSAMDPKYIISTDPILDRKSTRLNSSHTDISRMPSSA